MDTLTKSCRPTIVTANGEVQTHEEAIVYVKELDMFLTMKVLENTPAVLSPGKFCDKRVFLRMDQWSKTTSHQRREDAPNSDISPVPVSELVSERSGKPEEIQANEIPKPNKKETTIERGNPCGDSEIPEWLQEFRENLVDDEIPLQGGSHASSSHEASLEPTTKRREDLGKHNVYTHFPKNTEIARSVRGQKL